MNNTNKIPEDWVETTLGEVTEKMYSGGTPSTKRKDYYGGNIPWIRTQEVVFNFIYDTKIKISDLGLKNSSAKFIPRDTVIIAMYGNSAGRVAFSKIEATTNQACCNIICNFNLSNPYYIFYNLLGRYKEIEGKANGAAQQNLSVGVLKQLKITLPPLHEQKAIAAVLTAFDDKIALLQAQNHTLETTAQSIFKEWFGKYQLGAELPEGWKVETLKNISKEITRGFTSSYVIKSNLVNLNQKVNKGNYLDKQYFKYYAENTNVPENKFIKKYDILLNSLGEGTLGRLHLYCEETDNVVADQHISILRFDKKLAFYVYHNMISAEGQFRLLNNISGSTGMTMLNISKVRDFEIVIPPNILLEKFKNVLVSLYKKLEINNSQIQTLTKTRNVLLPKLMRGELRVKAFEQEAQKV